MKTKNRRWTAFEISMLGRIYDPEHGRRVRRSINQVWRKRTALQIPSLRQLKPQPWTPAEDRWLGTATDKVVAILLGRSDSSVAQHRRQLRIPPAARVYRNAWTAEELAQLGRKVDRETARILNRTLWTVKVHRVKLGIPAFPDPNPKFRAYTEADIKLLGTMRDDQLAVQLGRTRLAIEA